MYKTVVFIGRFQPYHNSHHETVLQALEKAEQVVIVIGSAAAAPNIKNPFSFAQRIKMIRQSFQKEQNARIKIVGVRDYQYSDRQWVTDVRNKVSRFHKDQYRIALIGHNKDESSYYLKNFQDWDFLEMPDFNGLSATEIRRNMFTDVGIFGWIWNVPFGTRKTMLDNDLELFRGLKKEYAQIQADKETYGAGPFITTDAVVMCNGHILMVKRGNHPGKGLFALPGGFLNNNETVAEAAVRELKEETGLDLYHDQAHEVKVFDSPSRCLRGRIVTHAHFYDVSYFDDLPEVKGADDAASAVWVPYLDLVRQENKIYSDHLAIINYFMLRKSDW